jgi:hypothetical protein
MPFPRTLEESFQSGLEVETTHALCCLGYVLKLGSCKIYEPLQPGQREASKARAPSSM